MMGGTRLPGRHRVRPADSRQPSLHLTPALAASTPRTCRVCGCTDDDCRQCIARTGIACHWVAADLCSACAPPDIIA
jgi:hypothetical protein